MSSRGIAPNAINITPLFTGLSFNSIEKKVAFCRQSLMFLKSSFTYLFADENATNTMSGLNYSLENSIVARVSLSPLSVGMAMLTSNI